MRPFYAGLSCSFSALLKVWMLIGVNNMPRTLLCSQEECKQDEGDYKFSKINNLEFYLIGLVDRIVFFFDLSVCFNEKNFQTYRLEYHLPEARTGADNASECSVICELPNKVTGLERVG